MGNTTQKELPFFKFKVAKWLTGDIVFEDFDVQGFFINVCAIYWDRKGKLSVEDVNKRYKNSPLLEKIIDRFVSVKEGAISIQFLDEQMDEVRAISKKNSENGSNGGRPFKINSGKILLYLLSCNLGDENFYKLGITNESISRRYSNRIGNTKKIPYYFDIVIETEVDFNVGLSIEEHIFNRYEKHYPKLKFSGHKECYKISDKIIEDIKSLINKGAKTEKKPEQTELNPKKSHKEKEEEKEQELERRKIEFKSTLKPFLQEYGGELLKDFYDYWTEPNKSRTKLKFEMQDTWDIGLRLKKWLSNEDKFKHKPAVQSNGLQGTY